MADTIHKLLRRIDNESGKTITTEVELVSYVKERSSGASESRYYVKHSISRQFCSRV